jgi:hypothetical protein
MIFLDLNYNAFDNIDEPRMDKCFQSIVLDARTNLAVGHFYTIRVAATGYGCYRILAQHKHIDLAGTDFQRVPVGNFRIGAHHHSVLTDKTSSYCHLALCIDSIPKGHFPAGRGYTMPLQPSWRVRSPAHHTEHRLSGGIRIKCKPAYTSGLIGDAHAEVRHLTSAHLFVKEYPQGMVCRTMLRGRALRRAWLMTRRGGKVGQRYANRNPLGDGAGRESIRHLDRKRRGGPQCRGCRRRRCSG